jgi:hypothetical protein
VSGIVKTIALLQIKRPGKSVSDFFRAKKQNPKAGSPPAELPECRPVLEMHPDRDCERMAGVAILTIGCLANN